MIKTNTNFNTNERNVRKCFCKHCGGILQAGEGIKIATRNTYGYAHIHCAAEYNGCYTTENAERVNRITKTNNCTISIELEVPHSALLYNKKEQFGWLKNEAKFLKTDDCTVWAEFKSPIYNNLLGLSKVLHNFQKLNRLNEWHNDNSYGTHLNIGNPDLNLAIIDNMYHSLFVPFCKYLQANPEKAEKLHGRNFGRWAMPINRGTNTQTHENFVNLQHSTHIEFRLAKLYTAKQYLMLARFYQDLVQKILIDYFQARYNEAMPSSAKRALANKASAKMIKLYEKYLTKLEAEEA